MYQVQLEIFGQFSIITKILVLAHLILWVVRELKEMLTVISLNSL